MKGFTLLKRGCNSILHQARFCFLKLTCLPFLKLAESSLETASRILQHLGEVMETTQRRMRSKRIEDRFLLSQEFIQAMTRVTSNLIEASSMLIHRYTYMPKYQCLNSPKWSQYISCSTSGRILLEYPDFRSFLWGNIDNCFYSWDLCAWFCVDVMRDHEWNEMNEWRWLFFLMKMSILFI